MITICPQCDYEWEDNGLVGRVCDIHRLCLTEIPGCPFCVISQLQSHLDDYKTLWSRVSKERDEACAEVARLHSRIAELEQHKTVRDFHFDKLVWPTKEDPYYRVFDEHGKPQAESLDGISWTMLKEKP